MKRNYSSPWLWAGALIFIGVASYAGRVFFPQENDTKTTVEKTLLAVSKGRPEFAKIQACDGSNFASWSSRAKIKDFWVEKSKLTTKLNGQWVIPVPCEITDEKGRRRKVTIFLDSYRKNAQCILYVKDPS